MKERPTRRWWLVALLVAAAAATASAHPSGHGSHQFVARITADATLGAAAVQAAVLPWRAEDGRSTLTDGTPERSPMSLAALLAALVAVPNPARWRPRRRHEGPSSTLVALRRAVALRAPPCLRPA